MMYSFALLQRAAGLCSGVVMGTLFFSGTLTAQSHGELKGKAAEVGKLFESQCMSCHLPPDPSFPGDRAWLNQIEDTA